MIRADAVKCVVRHSVDHSALISALALSTWVLGPYAQRFGQIAKINHAAFLPKETKAAVANKVCHVFS